MSKFHFRLATLLRLREATRDERRMQLAETQQADAELQNQLTRLDVDQQQFQRDYREAAAPGAINLPRLVKAQHYAATLRTQTAQLKQQRMMLTDEIDRRRHTLLEADRDVHTLEKLRQNQLEAHRQEEARQEIKRLDEVALQIVRP